MEVDSRTVKIAGAWMGTLSALIAGAWGLANFLTPYLQTKPPFAPQAEMVAVAQAQQQIIKDSDAMRATQLFLLQKLWENQAIEAQIVLRKNPYDVLAQRQLLAAQQALAGVQQQLSRQTR